MCFDRKHQVLTDQNKNFAPSIYFIIKKKKRMNEKKKENVSIRIMYVYIFFPRASSPFCLCFCCLVIYILLYSTPPPSPITHHRIQKGKKNNFQHSTFFVHFSPAHSTHSIFLLLLLLLFSWCVEIYTYNFFFCCSFIRMCTHSPAFFCFYCYTKAHNTIRPLLHEKNVFFFPFLLSSFSAPTPQSSLLILCRTTHPTRTHHIYSISLYPTHSQQSENVL
jgi:hypothetical protein